MTAVVRLDQLLPNFSYGDAIGNDVLALQAMFHAAGYPSEVFAQMRHPRMRSSSRDYSAYQRHDSPENLCLFHFSIGSSLSEFFGRRRSRKVLVYHNITPARYLEGVNRRAHFECRRGREELRRLASSVELAVADSEYNRQELLDIGYRSTDVLPIAVDFSRYDAAPRSALLKAFKGDWVNILHVGRFVPNKRIEDVVKSFRVYKMINPRSRLFLVGTDVSFENYSSALRGLISRLGVEDVHLPGHVDIRDLCTYYRMADLYLHMSEHEGFCVPLLEAMHFEVPIIAYRAAAVPDTLGKAGILVREKNFDEIAEFMDMVVRDKKLKDKLLAAGRERLKDFEPAAVRTRLWEVLSGIGIRPIPQ